MNSDTNLRLIGAWISVFCVPVLAALIFVSNQSGESRPGSRCRHNLLQIGLALHNYHEEYGTFPPQFTVDANGVRLHSWRTLILPFLDQERLFAKIDLARPWDHESNQASAQEILDRIFRCAYSSHSDTMPVTTYFAVIESPVWSGSTSTKFSDLVDPANVPVAIEFHNQVTPWAKPEDVSLSELVRSNDENDPLASPHTARGFFNEIPPSLTVLFADGHAEFTSIDDPRLKLGE